MTKEEAIRRIKSWNLDSDDMEVLSVVIPELAESEDEKIRKELLEEIEFIIPHEDETNSEGLILPSYHTRIDRYKSYLEKQKEQKEQKSRLTVKGNGVYKICPRCKSRMIRDISKVYTSMPPQYGYNCPKCGTMEFDTVMYDNPEMEEQKPIFNEDDDPFLEI